jgi:hypothetical protein
MKLYTVTPYRARTVGTHRKGREYPPRIDLAPMNHAAACNFAAACRNEETGYRITPWPEGTPHPKPPLYAATYRP